MIRVGELNWLVRVGVVAVALGGRVILGDSFIVGFDVNG